MNTYITNRFGNIEETFNDKQTKQFIKAIKGNKFECYFKLIMAYQLSRPELLNLEWKDIDFENDTITIYPISAIRNSRFYYSWQMTKLKEFKRTLPLLPSIKTLLLEEKEKHELNELNENYETSNSNFICLKDNGTRLNINTLSRNFRYVSRDNNLPQLLLSSLRISLDNAIIKFAKSYEFYRAWTRFDCITKRPKNIYVDYDLNSKRFIKALDDFICQDPKQSKSEMEM